MANYDILGNIAVLKFQDEVSLEEKLKKAQEIMNQYKSVKTVLEKLDKVHGRLRTIKTQYLIGEKTLVALYLENGCKFKLNIETCYFSPRLAGERNAIADKICKFKLGNKSSNKKLRVLVMFAGVSPFPIVLAKHCKNKIEFIDSVELGKECCKFGLENIKLNKVENMVNVIQGDVKRIIPQLIKTKKVKYDIIIMARPNLKETFLKEGLLVARKGTVLIYYGFSPEAKKEEMVKELEDQAKALKKKIKIIEVKEAGHIAPYEHRYRIEIKVLN